MKMLHRGFPVYITATQDILLKTAAVSFLTSSNSWTDIGNQGHLARYEVTEVWISIPFGPNIVLKKAFFYFIYMKFLCSVSFIRDQNDRG